MFPSARLKQLICPNPQPCSRGYFCFFNHDFSMHQKELQEVVSTSKVIRKRPAPSSSESTQKPSQEYKIQKNDKTNIKPFRPPFQASFQPVEFSVKKEQRRADPLVANLHPSSLPQIQPSLNSSIPREKRQKALEKIHVEFLRIYQDLEQHIQLAYVDSIKQESEIHSQSSPLSYATKIVGLLMRLRKRPKSLGAEDIGIDGEWKERPSKTKVNLDEDVPLEKLFKLVMTSEQLINYGYPVQGNARDTAKIDPIKNEPNDKINQKDFVDEADSKAADDANSTQLKNVDETDSTQSKRSIQICSRCDEKFTVEYPLSDIAKVACTHHWGKRRNLGTLGMGSERVWLCCQGDLTSKGCTQSPHVFKNECNDRSLFTSLPLSTEKNTKIKSVLAMDCEMGYTTGGYEMLRFTCVDWHGETMIDEIVRPENPIIDFNSRFSGIHSIPDKTKSISEIKQMLYEIATQDTIFIGHSLENDMEVLQIYHEKIIDTVQLYPHHRGLPYKNSLKGLTSEHLKRFIQEGEHSSVEDSLACLDLVKKKLANL